MMDKKHFSSVFFIDNSTFLLCALFLLHTARYQVCILTLFFQVKHYVNFSINTGCILRNKYHNYKNSIKTDLVNLFKLVSFDL